MSRKAKLLERLLRKPTDFTFEELTTLLAQYGFELKQGGKTGASAVVFANGDDYIRLHKPHPKNVLKSYQVADIITALKERDLL